MSIWQSAASKPATLTGTNNNYLASAGGTLSRIDNKLTRAAKKELDPARRPVRPPREEEGQVDAVIVQPRREVQGVRLVEAVAV